MYIYMLWFTLVCYPIEWKELDKVKLDTSFAKKLGIVTCASSYFMATRFTDNILALAGLSLLGGLCGYKYSKYRIERAQAETNNHIGMHNQWTNMINDWKDVQSKQFAHAQTLNMCTMTFDGIYRNDSKKKLCSYYFTDYFKNLNRNINGVDSFFVLGLYNRSLLKGREKNLKVVLEASKGFEHNEKDRHRDWRLFLTNDKRLVKIEKITNQGIKRAV